jgi:cytochrome c
MKKNCGYADKSWLSLAASAALVLGQGAYGQVLTYPGCNVSYSDGSFTQESLVKWSGAGANDPSLSEPVKLTVGTDATGSVEVYFVELNGSFKVYKDKTKAVTKLGTIAVSSGKESGNPEQGLMGVVLDPGFKTNNFVYLYHSVEGRPAYALTRVTLNADHSSFSGNKVILEFPVQYNDCCHTGGGMHFDDLGDLWLSIGNNEGRGTDGYNESDKIKSGEWGSSSTASLRGGIIRIHPNPDGTYSIPAGNFGEFWSNKFAASNPALAAEYKDKTKVRPEIYVKGNRNPYGIAVDPVRRFVATGDVGPDGERPDASSMGEDHDLYTQPSFAGWPYFAGNDRKNGPNWASKDPSRPTNTSKWNAGVKELPPAHNPLWEERNSASFAGFFYNYKSSNTNPNRLPAIFHNHVVWGNWGTSSFYVSKIGDDGRMQGSRKTILGGKRFNGPTDIQVGPDGLYVVNYAGFFNRAAETRIDRFKWTGAQCNVVSTEKAGCQATDPSVTHNVPSACLEGSLSKGFEFLGSGRWRKKSALGGLNGMLEIPQGIAKVEVFDMQGRNVFAFDNAARASSMRLPDGFEHGLYQVIMSK